MLALASAALAQTAAPEQPGAGEELNLRPSIDSTVPPADPAAAEPTDPAAAETRSVSPTLGRP